MTFIDGRDGLDRGRPADHGRDRARRARRSSTEHARRAAGRRGDLHAQPRRPLRRGARRDRDRRTRRQRCGSSRPQGFLEAAISENVIAGNAMARRARVHVRRPAAARTARPRRHRARQGAPHRHAGPDRARPRRSPTTGTELDDRRRRASCSSSRPDTEAPAEMNFYFPEHAHAVHGGELHRARCTTSTRRAARRCATRSAGASYIDEAIELFRGRTEVVFASHHWPRWGASGVARPPRDSSATSTGTSTTRRCGSPTTGHDAGEIAEELELPRVARDEFACRELLRHRQPQREGRLPALPRLVRRQPGAPRSAPARGGGAALRRVHGRRRRPCSRRRASRSTQGDYRWVAQVVNHVVFADPDNARGARAPGRRPRAARLPGRVGAVARLLPDRRARAAPGRGAGEHDGRLTEPGPAVGFTAEMVLHVVGVRVDGPRADGRVIELDVVFYDVDESFRSQSRTGRSAIRGADARRRRRRFLRRGWRSWR